MFARSTAIMAPLLLVATLAAQSTIHSGPAGRVPNGIDSSRSGGVTPDASLAFRQFERLPKRGLPTTRTRTCATAFGDIDSDGDLDLIVGNAREQNRLYLNDGAGTYSDATASHMPTDLESAREILLGDVDSDGDLDMVLANNGLSSGEQNRLYLNDGAGTYSDVTAARMPPDRDFTIGGALGDVDADGDLDIVFANTTGQQNRLYLNDGFGFFADVTAKQMPFDAEWTSAVALADVDGDGDRDILLANRAAFSSGRQGQNRLYLNDGFGTYIDASAGRMPTVSDDTWAVAMADVDNDGYADIVFGNSGQNRLYFNDGAGSFVDATATRMPAGSHWTRAVALGDVDGDLDVDIIVANGGDQNRVYLNDGFGIFSDGTSGRLPVYLDNTSAAVMGDVDGDGDLDICFGNSQDRLYLNDGTGTYADATARRIPSALASVPSASALGDVDGDGDLDIVIGNIGFRSVTCSIFCLPYSGQQNRLYRNDGSGTFTDATADLPADGDATAAVALGDVDGDGDLDLVCGNVYTLSSQNRLYLNDGTGRFADATATRMPTDSSATRAIALCDVDDDDDLDIVCGNGDANGQQNRIYLNDGSGTFADATATHMPVDGDRTHAFAFGDVDSDGDPDIVCGNGGFAGEQNRLYLNDGTGSFVDATATHMPADSDGTRAVALGDVDGDGDVDGVFGNGAVPAGQQNRLYLNDGTGVFIDATATRLPADGDESRAAVFGDLDDDGDLDILFGNSAYSSTQYWWYGDEQNRLYFNDGNGVYTDLTAARLAPTLDATLSVALGDIDGDRDLDIVVSNASDYANQSNRLDFNLLRQLDAPVLLRVGQPFTLEAYARFGPRGTMDVALPFLAAGTASIPLPPFGTFGLDPAQLLALPPVVIPRPGGMGELSFTVPNLPGLSGASIHAQAVLLSPPFQARLTNTTSDVVLR